MLEPATAETLLGDGPLAVSMVQPGGAILFENRAAREMLGREVATADSILDSLTVPSAWGEMIGKLHREGTLEDEPLLLQTPHGNAEVCYATIIPQYAAEGILDRLLCVWATRRKMMSSPLAATDTGTLTEYTRDLEQVLEHRTYQNLLTAEQNEFARDALDVLPVGILAVSQEGQILYRNHAMTDQFGFRPSNYVQLDVQHVLEPDLNAAFQRVVNTKTRQFLCSSDPGGNWAAVDLLPLLRMNRTHTVVIQFSRCESKGESA